MSQVMKHYQCFGTLKIPVSTYVLHPDNIEPLEYLRSILNYHTIHSIVKPDPNVSLHLLNWHGQSIATVEMHDINVEWEFVYDEN